MSAPYDPEHITYFAETDYRSQRQKFGIKSRDRTRHMYVIGKSGVGKSTLLENMAIQDIAHGDGVAVLDPHGSFAEKMLEYIPMDRIKDVVYFAPFDSNYPISFNVLEDVGADKRHFVASGLMSTFKKIWVDAWSARMEYILNNILLALLEYPNSTLLGVNRMLSDKIYRNKVVDNITDPGVKAFWIEEFAKYGDRYMQEAGAAIQNKIGQLTANPLIRNIIGQPKSSFDIRKVMDGQKILIINLSKGRIGEQNTSLLGSMIITKIYLAAMSRAEVPAQQMAQLSNFYFYVDEFQSFANETFADILAEARKYKLALIIAHQYVAQMEEKVRDAVFGNVGTTVSFRVGPLDGELLEKVMSPQFTQNDLVNLGMAQIYLTLMINDIGSSPFSAKTLPPLQRPTISYRNDVIEYSRETFAMEKEQVEENIRAWYDDGVKPEEKKEKRQFEPKQFESRDMPYVQQPQSHQPGQQYQPQQYRQPQQDRHSKQAPQFHQPFKKAIESQHGQQNSQSYDHHQSGVSHGTSNDTSHTKPYQGTTVQNTIHTIDRPKDGARTNTPHKNPEKKPFIKKQQPEKISSALHNLLDAIEVSSPSVLTPAPAAPVSATPIVSVPIPATPIAKTEPVINNKPTSAAAPAKAPFAGEKPLRESLPPVKLAERGPSQQNKDLLKATLAKALQENTAKKASQHTAQTVVQHTTQTTTNNTQNDIHISVDSTTYTPPAPIATDTSQKEIAYQDLKKILE